MLCGKLDISATDAKPAHVKIKTMCLLIFLNKMLQQFISVFNSLKDIFGSGESKQFISCG